MTLQERHDSRRCIDEIASQIWQRRLADDHEQSHVMPYDRRELVRHVADALVVGYGDAAVFTDVSQPFLIRASGGKELVVPFHGEPGGREDFGEALT